MIRIQLGEADRQRLGCPEWLEYDPESLMVRESITIKKMTGFTVEMLGKALQDNDTEALWVMVWVALRQSGVTVPLETLDFDLGAMKIPRDEDEDEGKGEAQETSPTS